MYCPTRSIESKRWGWRVKGKVRQMLTQQSSSCASTFALSINAPGNVGNHQVDAICLGLLIVGTKRQLAMNQAAPFLSTNVPHLRCSSIPLSLKILGILVSFRGLCCFTRPQMRQPIRAQLLPPADLLVTLLCIANSPRILFRYAKASVWDRKVQPTSSPGRGECSEGQWALPFTRLRGGGCRDEV